MKKLLISCFALLALAACEGDDDGLGPVRGDEGALRYARSGGTQIPSGTYEAVGAVPRRAGGPELGEWAYAGTGLGAGGGLLVIGSIPTANGRYDLVEVQLPADARAGDRFEPVLDCAFGFPRSCGEVRLSIGVVLLDVAPEANCVWQEGEIRVTSRTETRIRGTFSARTGCVDGDGDVAAGEGETLQLTGGAFDVPILASPSF